MESFFQAEINKLNVGSDVVVGVKLMMERVSRNAIRVYLKDEDYDKWMIRGKVDNGIIERLRNKVKLDLTEYQELIENLENSQEINKDLNENLEIMKDTLNSQKLVLEYLKDFRRPMHYDINQTIEYYSQVKEEYNKYISNIEKANKKLEENIRKIQETQNELEIMMMCQKFLIENFSASQDSVRKSKDKSKTYSIKVFGAEHTNKVEEKTLEIKSKLTVKPQKFEFTHGFSNDLSTRLLESPFSSNNSQDSPIDSSHSSKINSPILKNRLNSPSCKLTSPSNLNLNRQNIERLKMIKKKTEFHIDISPKAHHNIYLSPPIKSSKDSKNSSNSSLSLSKSIDCIDQFLSSSPQITEKKSPKQTIHKYIEKSQIEYTKPKSKIISEALNNLKQII